MSHFTVTAILPGGIDTKDISDTLDRMMAPFDENTFVEEYEQECWCVARNAREWVSAQMAKHFDLHWLDTATGKRIDFKDIPKTPLPIGIGSDQIDEDRYKQKGGVHELRESFKDIKDAINAKPEYEGVPDEYDFKFVWPAKHTPEHAALSERYEAKKEEVQAAWKAHLAPWVDTEAAFQLQYEAEFGAQPDPNCGFYSQEDLDHYLERAKIAAPGSGASNTYVVTQDDEGYWNVTISAYESKYHPDETIRFKIGDKKLDEDGFEDRYNFCYGSGKTLTQYNPQSKWDWWVLGGRWDGALAGLEEIDDNEHGFNFGDEFHQPDRNVVKLADSNPDFTPYAYITPDGVWHGQGEMGWWGISRGDEERTVWAEEWATIRKEYGDNLAAQLDCHI